MKHIQKIIAFVVLIGIFHISYGDSMKVEEVKVLDANTLSVTLSENPNLDAGEVKGEITILNDVAMRGAVLSESNENTVELMLEDAITPETSYSLLTISGADGSIEFTTPKDVEGFIATNAITGDTQNITSIEVLDEKTLNITYNKTVSSSAYEYKLLAESKVVKIEKPDYFVPELIISLEPPLSSNKNYILMFIEMQDVDGNFLEFDTGIYDFKTEEITPVEVPQENTDTPVMLEENTDNTETSVEENMDTPVETSEENTNTPDELNAAPEMSLEKDASMDTLEAAKNVSETPDTGAETWVLIIATLVINTFYYLSRRKKAIFA